MPASLRRSIKRLASVVKFRRRCASSRLGVGRRSITSALLAENAASLATFSRILGYSSVRILFSCICVCIFPASLWAYRMFSTLLFANCRVQLYLRVSKEATPTRALSFSLAHLALDWRPVAAPPEFFLLAGPPCSGLAARGCPERRE